MQRLELQNHRELRRFLKFVFDNVTGNFFCLREWESHNYYFVKANSLEIFGGKAGALVGASFLKSPGKKNDAGETLVLVLMPLQPAPKSATVASIASHRKL